MKILQIIPSLASGGAERFVVDLCNELNVQGEDVYLCILLNSQDADYGFYLPELNNSVHFIALNQSKGFRLNKIWLLYKLIRDTKPNIVHIHLSIYLYVYFLSLINFRTPFFFTIHSLAEKACHGFHFRLLNFIYYLLGLINVIVISDECKLSYEKFYGLHNATLIYNGRKKNTPSFRYQEVLCEINKLKQNGSDLVFVHVARFEKSKNQKLLIQVFNRLEQEGFNFLLLIIGDWSFCNEAQELAKKANSRIHFLGTKHNVTDYLLLGDAFCLTSIYEGMPISLLEALSCGCTPVCTPVGGIKDIIKDEVTGFLSQDITEYSYYDAIKRFINQRTKIKKDLLIKFFEANYLIEKTASKHISLYNKYKK